VWLLAAFAVLFVGAPAGAQDGGEDAPGATEDTEAEVTEELDAPFVIFGTLTAQVGDERQPVEGASVIVLTLEGDEVDTGTSGADGRWEVGLEEGGEYLVRLDVNSLPDGVTVGGDGTVEREVAFSQGRVRVGALFPLGDAVAAPPAQPDPGTGELDDTTDRAEAVAAAPGRSAWERFLQLAVEGIRFGLLLGMMSIGLSLIFGTTGLTNFAHAEMVTWGALAAYFFNVVIGVNLIPAAILATLSGALAGALFDWGIFRRLRNRGVGLVAQLVVSIGLSLFLRYVFLYLFRGDRRSYAQFATQRGTEFGPISLLPKDIVAIVLSAAVLGLVGLLLQRTRTGRAMRAVADNRDLASSSGINVQRVILQVWMLGGSLAALSGVLFGLSEAIAWDMGFKILLLIFAGVTLGGLGTAFGAAVGSLLIGIMVMVSTMVIPPELKNVGALGILVLVLVVRPQGILGRSERIG